MDGRGSDTEAEESGHTGMELLFETSDPPENSVPKKGPEDTIFTRPSGMHY